MIFISCSKDFIVKDIKNDYVTILAPANNVTTPNNTVTFWWEKLDGAQKYNVQIVKPTFLSVQQFIADTNVTGTKFILSLTPGTYQWRIRAVNNGGNSQYTTYNLTIDTSSNLSSQLVVAITPIDGYLTGTNAVSFSWNAIASADKYEIQILNSTSTTIKDTITTNTTYHSSFADGKYTWKVKALNDYSISQYNTPLSYTVDLTAPVSSILSYPANGSNVKDTISLKWTRVITNSTLDTKYDSLFVAFDSLFTNVASKMRIGTTSIKVNQLNPSLSVSSTTFPYYYWRVRSVDSVGNRSSFSNQFKFKLLP
ncbi:MAG: fibronectin type III domain-containing protein [Bacteroidota bacterium]|nr:fibronectin type III domain-containing protein [Bacteroidota bacterium]